MHEREPLASFVEFQTANDADGELYAFGLRGEGGWRYVERGGAAFIDAVGQMPAVGGNDNVLYVPARRGGFRRRRPGGEHGLLLSRRELQSHELGVFAAFIAGEVDVIVALAIEARAQAGDLATVAGAVDRRQFAGGDVQHVEVCLGDGDVAHDERARAVLVPILRIDAAVDLGHEPAGLRFVALHDVEVGVAAVALGAGEERAPPGGVHEEAVVA